MAFRKNRRTNKNVRKSAKKSRHTRKRHLGGNKYLGGREVPCPHGKHRYVCKICRKKYFETF